MLSRHFSTKMIALERVDRISSRCPVSVNEKVDAQVSHWNSFSAPCSSTTGFTNSRPFIFDFVVQDLHLDISWVIHYTCSSKCYNAVCNFCPIRSLLTQVPRFRPRRRDWLRLESWTVGAPVVCCT